MSLEDWGWDQRWAEAFADSATDGLWPGRVIEEQRGLLRVLSAAGERAARVPGALRFKAAQRAELPAVGDWVACEDAAGGDASVRLILPRRTKLSRKVAGEVLEEQVIAANLDAVLVMTALNADFNARRIERFLSVCRESDAEPVLVLNKLDACPDAAPFLERARAVCGATPVLALSAKTGAGLEGLAPWIRPGLTIGLVGSSGVGKSTLVNRLAGTELRVSETRASDERGRHTTAHRQLFVLPGGGVVLDTPGMREMQFWEASQGVSETFGEIEALAASCRFKDCGHDAEPDCAVKDAVEQGSLPATRLQSWRKLQGELERRNRRGDPKDKGR